MSEETTKAPRADRAASREKRAAGKAKRAEGQASAKADVTAHEIVLTVSRVAAGFEAMLKTKTPALSLSQWAMLESLSQEGGMGRPSHIARNLGFSRQLIRQATKKLLASELISQTAREEGKKAVDLALTGAGRAALADIVATTDGLSKLLSNAKRGGAAAHTARTLELLSTELAVKQANPGKRRGKREKKAQTADAVTADA